MISSTSCMNYTWNSERENGKEKRERKKKGIYVLLFGLILQREDESDHINLIINYGCGGGGGLRYPLLVLVLGPGSA